MFEVAITMALVTIMALIVEGTIASTHEAEMQLTAVRNAVERGERITYEVLEEVEGSRRLFQDDTTGQGYLDAMDLTRDPMLSSARLPVFDELNGLGPDTPGDPRTGNVLAFVRETDAAPAVADPATQKIRYIDVYRFVCIYPHETSRVVVVDPSKELARDLVVWRSVPYPSYPQIMAIASPTERSAVIADLVDRFGMTMAWDPDGDVDASFYSITSGGAISPTATTIVTIEEDLDVSDRGRLVYGNIQLARTDQTSYHRKNIFTKDNPAVWAPDGFEVKIVGVSGARKVWIHTVVEAQARGGVVIPQSSTVIASPKDL